MARSAHLPEFGIDWTDRAEYAERRARNVANPVRSCVRDNGLPKLKYATAREAAAGTAARHAAKPHHGLALPYVCPHCAQWHVGRPPSGPADTFGPRGSE